MTRRQTIYLLLLLAGMGLLLCAASAFIPTYAVPPWIGSFKGSAVVTANQFIAVVANHYAAYSTDDAYMSHAGLNR